MNNLNDDNELEQRLNAWVEAGVITPSDAAAIREMEYGHRERLAEKPSGLSKKDASSLSAKSTPVPAATPMQHGDEHVSGRLAGLLGGIGGLLIGLGVLLIVATNWQSIGPNTKLITLILAMVVAQLAGLIADARGVDRWIGTSAYVVGILIFAGSVFLLGQTFNVKAHDPLGFLMVAIAGSILAVISTRKLVGWVAAAAWLAWWIFEIVELFGRSSDERTFSAIMGIGLLGALTATAAGVAIHGVSRRFTADWRSDLGTLGSPMRSVGLLVLLGGLVPATFVWRISDKLQLVQLDKFVIIASVISAVAIVFAARYNESKFRGLVALALFLILMMIDISVVTQSPMLVAVLANLTLICVSGGLLFLGLADNERELYVWGVIWVFALIAARYVDILISIDLGGLGFIGVGILLIGGAWLISRSRKAWQERKVAR